MTPDQIHDLRKSFRRVEAWGHVAALVFYRKLFEIAPHVRPMFKADIESQSEKLMEMIGAALSLLERPEELTLTLRRLGARHTGYGVKAEHYAPVGAALLHMLEEVLSADFTPELRATWAQLYAVIAETMQQGAAAAAAGHPISYVGKIVAR